MTDEAKYLFETSFDEDGADIPNPAVDEAYERGRLAGIESARHEAQSHLAAACGQIVERLTALEAVRVELDDALSRQAIAVAADLIRKMMPAFVERGGLAEIEHVLIDALGHVVDEPRVVFRLADQIMEDLRHRIDELSRKAGYGGEIVLIADDRLGPSDCLVEWADGGAERNIERQWSEVEQILARALDDHFATARPAARTNTQIPQA